MKNLVLAVRRLALLCLPALLVACATPQEAVSLAEVTPDKVMLVGEIQLVPALTPEELNIRMGTGDPFDSKSVFHNRALLHFADQAGPRSRTFVAINPLIGKTFFYTIPRDRPYVVDGYVMKRAGEGTEYILLPVPFKVDVRPGDSAVYIGTIRLHRDEFNEVTKLEVLDNSSRAAAEFRKKFGKNAVFRKAIAGGGRRAD